MKTIQARIAEIRTRNKSIKDARKYISCWSEKDILNGKVADAFVLILRTRGCYWALKSGCSMCGYLNDSVRKAVSDEDILQQFSNALQKYHNESIVKIYTSGSFLDEHEISENVRNHILSSLNGKARKLIIETRPEFVSQTVLNKISKIFKNIEVAIGLESANDIILRYSINKGFELKDYIKAVRIVRKVGLSLKTYVLIKPPFLTEREAINDAIKSAVFASKYSQTISFNPVNIQNFTLVEQLWRNGEYRPPWLWSVVEILKRSYELSKTRLLSAPTSGGSPRGAHNCGICDARILQAIENFSLYQNTHKLEALDCKCKEQWVDLLELERFIQGSFNIERTILRG